MLLPISTPLSQTPWEVVWLTKNTITLRNIIDPQKYHMTERDYLNSNLIFAIISLNIKIPKVRFFFWFLAAICTEITSKLIHV